MKSTARPSRSYVMRARADAVAETRRRIVDAGVDLLWGKRPDDVRLQDIAARAEVTVQTVLRIFGDRDRLFEIVSDAIGDRIMTRREEPAPGDVGGTIRAL